MLNNPEASKNASVFWKRKISNFSRFREGVMPAIMETITHKLQSVRRGSICTPCSNDQSEFVIPTLSRRELKDCKLFLLRVQLDAVSPKSDKNRTKKFTNTTQRAFSPQPIIKNIINQRMKNKESGQLSSFQNSIGKLREFFNTEAANKRYQRNYSKTRPDIFDSEEYITPQNKKNLNKTGDEFCSQTHIAMINNQNHNKYLYNRELSCPNSSETLFIHSGEKGYEDHDEEYSLAYSNCKRLITSSRKKKNKQETSSSIASHENCGCKIKVKQKDPVTVNQENKIVHRGLKNRTIRGIQHQDMEQIIEDTKEGFESGQQTSDHDSIFTQIDERKKAIDKYRKQVISRFKECSK